MSEHQFRKPTTFLKKLEQAHIHYTLASHRDDAIMVLVTVPGERWEIEFLGDGSVEVERFLSNGEICGEEALHDLLRKYGNPDHAEAV
jgi:hypothetical protein